MPFSLEGDNSSKLLGPSVLVPLEEIRRRK
jgi:hypothetical protein